MPTKRLFAIDLGASGGKCFLGEFTDGQFRMQELHRFQHEGISFFLPDRAGTISERTYWDDTSIYAHILQGLRTFRREVGPDLDSVAVDAWGADGLLISEDSEMLGKIHCYRDHRLDQMVEEVKTRMDPTRMYAITGIHFHPFNISNQLRWLVMHRRDLLRPNCRFLPVPTVFGYYLGGVTQVDSAWASVTQLMDARKRCWSAPVLEALEIPARILPAIVPPGTVVGTLQPRLAEHLGVHPAAIVAVGAHDTASAFAAAPVDHPDRALIISSGTWSLLGKLIAEPITSDPAMAAGISNEGGIGNTRFLKNCMGSWIAQELLRGWERADGSRMPWSEADRLTEAAAPFAAMIHPDDPGFYNPSDMEAAILNFLEATGQPRITERGALLRLVYESLAFRYRQVRDQIDAISATESGVVHIVGGGSNNDLLNQFTANAMGTPVLAGPTEATAVGNLMVQACALDVIAGMEAAQPLIRSAFPIREFLPQNESAWQQAYERFQQIAGGQS